MDMKKALKRARKKAGLSQTQLSEKIGVHFRTIQNWEQGIATPSIDMLLYLTKFYGCSLDYLTGRIDCTTHDIQYIHDKTGLSEDAIRKLQDLPPDQAAIVSKIIEHDGFSRLIKQTNALCDKETISSGYALLIIDHVRKELQDQKTFPVDNGNMVEQAMLFTLSNIFSGIICDITETKL